MRSLLTETVVAAADGLARADVERAISWECDCYDEINIPFGALSASNKRDGAALSARHPLNRDNEAYQRR